MSYDVAPQPRSTSTSTLQILPAHRAAIKLGSRFQALRNLGRPPSSPLPQLDLAPPTITEEERQSQQEAAVAAELTAYLNEESITLEQLDSIDVDSETAGVLKYWDVSPFEC